MNFSLDDIRRQIPAYLSDSNKETLVKELEAIARGNVIRFTLADHEDAHKEAMLQGDGWAGFSLFEFEKGERRSVRGLVLSNSCDVSLENARDLPSRITFAPLLKLSAYRSLLVGAKVSEDRIDAKLGAIRAQQVTSIFFLPRAGKLEEDYIVPFDDLHSMPLSALPPEGKLFTLNSTGFYMLVLKLSLHLCRLHEGVDRSPQMVQEAKVSDVPSE